MHKHSQFVRLETALKKISELNVEDDTSEDFIEKLLWCMDVARAALIGDDLELRVLYTELGQILECKINER